MNALQATRDFLRTECPYIDPENRFNANYTGGRAVNYSLAMAAESHTADVTGKDVASVSLSFSASLPWGEAIQQNLNAVDFFSDLADWILRQNRAGNRPAVDGYTTDSMTVSNAGQVLSVDANSARYQMQIRLTFEEA